MKTAAWSIAVVAGALALPAGASSELAQAGPARAYLDFTIKVPRVALLRLLNHPTSIDVTADDIARGKVVVSGASLDLIVNNPLGYVLRADLMNAMFTAARIVNLPSRMATMVGKPRPAAIPVEYELSLAPDAQPGRYAWPVALSLQDP